MSNRSPLFWLLAPWLIVFMIVLLWIEKDNALALIVGLELLAALVLLGLFDSQRFGWAWRGVGGLLFLGFLAYFVSMLIEGGGAVRLPRRKGEANVINALLGLIVFGLPGLCYAMFGRLTWRSQESVDDNVDDEDNAGDEDQ